MIEVQHPQIHANRQCELLGLARSTFYYRQRPERDLNLHLMNVIDEQYTKTPFYGIPRMTAWLNRQGFAVNHKRVARLMKAMEEQGVIGPPEAAGRRRRVIIGDGD